MEVRGEPQTLSTGTVRDREWQKGVLWPKDGATNPDSTVHLLQYIR